MTASDGDPAGPAGPPGAPRALPAPVLVGAAAALLALTALTVASSRVELGPLNLVVALAIAALKASLVALFFMHLLYERRFQAVVLVAAVAFAAVFVGFVVFDTTQYQPGIRAEAAARAALR